MFKKKTIIFILELPKVRKYVLHQQDIDPMSMQTVIELTLYILWKYNGKYNLFLARRFTLNQRKQRKDALQRIDNAVSIDNEN